MPKIVIREIDNTNAGGAAYANFSVVVPGFVGATANLDVFDENGVYECKTQQDFKTNVGLTSSIKHKVASAEEPVTAEDWDEAKALTSDEFDTYVAEGKLYLAAPNTTGNIGERRDETYIYELATVENKSKYVFKANAEASAEGCQLFMLLDKIGHDDIYEAHHGNQIAYELLGLGYTVLYKKLDATVYLEDFNFWEPLRDKTLYDFRYLISGLIKGNAEVYTNMKNIAEFKPENEDFDKIGVDTHGRGDCIALFDIDEDVYSGKAQEAAISAVLSFAKEIVPQSKYAAVFAPTVKYTKGSLSEVSAFGNNQTFPASFHYLACAARSSERYNEWYANAGYTRGISSYTIDSVGCKFGEAAVNMFQKRASDPANNVTMAINPIINLRGSYYLWGNRTTEALGATGTPNGDLRASHFLNIRQLCSTIKKKVYVACRQITFDPNSDLLWINFCNSIKPMLEKMKADQGIADYKISKVKTPRKAFLSVVITIVPIEAVEDFDISIHLEDSLEGVIATAEE